MGLNARRLLDEKISQGATGELVVVSEGQEIHLYLQRGKIAWGTTTTDRFLFRRYLCETLGVDPEVLSNLVSDCFRHRRPLGEALVQSGLLPGSKVREALGVQAMAAVHALDACVSSAQCLFLNREAPFSSYDSSLTFTLADLVGGHSPGAALGLTPVERWHALGHQVVRRAGSSHSGIRRGTAVVVDQARRRVHEFNETATFLWERIDGRRSVEDLTREFIGAFQLQEAFARDEVAAFLHQAIEQGLLEFVQAEVRLPG
jgi:hypothetical protein